MWHAASTLQRQPACQAVLNHAPAVDVRCASAPSHPTKCVAGLCPVAPVPKVAAGFFDSGPSTKMQAFDSAGKLLGSITNTMNGIEFLGLATDDGSSAIAGVLWSNIRFDPFGIDNLRFTYECCN
jgi:hypothetical protein